jgi:hypothetical protein
MPDHLDQATTAAAEYEQVTTHWVALQRFLHHQRQTGKPLRISVWPVANQTFTPRTGIIAYPNTIDNAAQRIRVDIAIHADTPTLTKFDRYIAAVPA